MATEDEHLMLELILSHLGREGGRLVISCRPELDGSDINDRWVAGYEFGREAEDSEMAAGAAYGTGATMEAALATVVQGLPKPPELWSRADWAGLQADLDELERTDPEVKAARERLDDAIAAMGKSSWRTTVAQERRRLRRKLLQEPTE